MKVVQNLLFTEKYWLLRAKTTHTGKDTLTKILNDNFFRKRTICDQLIILYYETA